MGLFLLFLLLLFLPTLNCILVDCGIDFEEPGLGIGRSLWRRAAWGVSIGSYFDLRAGVGSHLSVQAG